VDRVPELILGRTDLRGLLPLNYQNVFDYRQKNPLQHSIPGDYRPVYEFDGLNPEAQTSEMLLFIR
jgi:hypothetical protein